MTEARDSVANNPFVDSDHEKERAVYARVQRVFANTVKDGAAMADGTWRLRASRGRLTKSCTVRVIYSY